MKIKKIKFENFRLFESLEVNFPDSNFIVLIGNNGAGKTSILDGIALSFMHFTGDLLSADERYRIESYFDNDDITIEKNEGKVIIQFEYNVLNRNNDLKTISITKNRKQTGFGFDKTPEKFVEGIKKSIRDNTLKSLPIVAYYNVNRTLTNNLIEKTKDGEKSISTYDEKLHAYIKTLNLNLPIFKDFEQWFLKQEIKENFLKVSQRNLKLDLPALKNVRSALEKYLSIIEPGKFGKLSILRNSEMNINFTENTYEYLSVEREGKILKFTQMSSGEKMVLLLVVDIARRLTIANENSEDALNGEGIVLIDELELHLHPNWQLRIVKALKATFPNVQFIATTHSPKVITSLEQQDVLVLENGKVYNINQNPLGRDDNSALEEFMDSSKRPVEIENKISKIFDKLAGKNINYDEIEAEIEKLKSILSADDPVFVRFNSIIERKKLLEV